MAGLHKETSGSMNLARVVVLVIFFSSLVSAQTNPWVKSVMHHIRILESTQNEVEQVLTSNNKEYAEGKRVGNVVFYTVKGANITALYSKDCLVDGSLDADPKKNILVEITLDFGGEVSMSEFDFNLRRFRIYRDPNSPRIQWYDDKLGITIVGGEKPNRSKLVSQIKFSPTSAQKEENRCAARSAILRY